MINKFIKDRNANDRLYMWLLLNEGNPIKFAKIGRILGINRHTARRKYLYLIDNGYMDMKLDIDLEIINDIFTLGFNNALKIYLLQPRCSLTDIVNEIGYSSTHGDIYDMVKSACIGLEEIGLLDYGFLFKEMENEIFMNIDGYDGDYQVSNFGRVVSHKKNYIREMSLLINYHTCSSYPLVQVLLSKDSNQIMYNVARLVATTFMPLDDYTNMEVHHVDKNPMNNRLENLVWLSREEHMKVHGRLVKTDN